MASYILLSQQYYDSDNGEVYTFPKDLKKGDQFKAAVETPEGTKDFSGCVFEVVDILWTSGVNIKFSDGYLPFPLNNTYWGPNENVIVKDLLVNDKLALNFFTRRKTDFKMKDLEVQGIDLFHSSVFLKVVEIKCLSGYNNLMIDNFILRVGPKETLL